MGLEELPASICRLPLMPLSFDLSNNAKTNRALIGVIGQRTRVYEVMRGDRPLSLSMIRKLHSKLGIPAEVLIQPPRSPRMRAERAPAGRSKRTRPIK